MNGDFWGCVRDTWLEDTLCLCACGRAVCAACPWFLVHAKGANVPAAFTFPTAGRGPLIKHWVDPRCQKRREASI